MIWLPAAGCNLAVAQNPPSSGVLQPPSGSPHDQPVRPPAAAPRLAVHRLGTTAADKTPVVTPHGSLHPHKSVATEPPGKAPLPSTPVQMPPAVVPAPVEKPPEPETADSAAAKLPRFASLRSDDVNMRAGPGTRYPIDWVYRRRELPVEIEREFDVWRWVRDADGIRGWVHQATLMGRRSFVVRPGDATLRSAANDAAAAVAVLKLGVIGRIRSCPATSDWCDVQTGSYRGYLRREQFWGVLPGEAVNP